MHVTMDEEESEYTDYNIPADKLYAVVELVVNKPNEEGESDVEKYSCPAATNWLKDVRRIENGEGQVRYVATCLWPKNEEKLSFLLERRSKPSSDWLSYEYTRVLKFCRSIGHAKEQSKKASYQSLSESDNAGLRKRTSVRPSWFGFQADRDEKSDSDSDSERPPIKSLKIMKAQNVRLPARQQAAKNIKTAGPKDVAACSQAGEKPCSSRLELNCKDPSDTVSAIDMVPAQRVSHKKNVISDSEDEMAAENLMEREEQGTCLGQTCRTLDFDSTSNESAIKVPTNKEKEGSSKEREVTSREKETGPSTLTESSEKSKQTAKSNESNQFQRKCLSSPRRPTFSPRKVRNVLNPVTHATFLREVQDIRRLLNGLTISVNKIYNCVCPILDTTSNDNTGMPGLPVNSFEDMIVWEKFLHDHDNALNVVRLLTERCVLTSLRDSVYSMLKFLVSNKLASSYNYKGKNKKGAKIPKASFFGTRSCTAVNAALKAYEGNLKKSGTTLSYSTGPIEVGSAIGLWLKDAPKRFLIELKSSRKVPDTEVRVPEDMLLVPPADLDLELDE